VNALDPLPLVSEGVTDKTYAQKRDCPKRRHACATRIVPFSDPDTTLLRFNKLMRTVMTGDWRRHTFRPWEMDLLLDIGQATAGMRSRAVVLRKYQRAVQRKLEKEGGAPLLLSEYLNQGVPAGAREDSLPRPNAGSNGFGICQLHATS
jgi:hypothetical protein